MAEKNCLCIEEKKPVKMTKISYGCGCVGYGYVPVQELNDVYDADTAFMCGTVFPELALSIDEYGCVCKGGDCDD